MRSILVVIGCLIAMSSAIAQNLEYRQTVLVADQAPSQSIAKAKRWLATQIQDYNRAHQYQDDSTLIVSATVQSTISSYNKFVPPTPRYYTYKVLVQSSAKGVVIELKDFTNQGHATSTRDVAIKNIETASGIGKKMKATVISQINEDFDNLDRNAENIINGIQDAIVK